MESMIQVLEGFGHCGCEDEKKPAATNGLGNSVYYYPYGRSPILPRNNNGRGTVNPVLTGQFLRANDANRRAHAMPPTFAHPRPWEMPNSTNQLNTLGVTAKDIAQGAYIRSRTGGLSDFGAFGNLGDDEAITAPTLIADDTDTKIARAVALALPALRNATNTLPTRPGVVTVSKTSPATYYAIAGAVAGGLLLLLARHKKGLRTA